MATFVDAGRFVSTTDTLFEVDRDSVPTLGLGGGALLVELAKVPLVDAANRFDSDVVVAGLVVELLLGGFTDVERVARVAGGGGLDDEDDELGALFRVIGGITANLEWWDCDHNTRLLVLCRVSHVTLYWLSGAGNGRSK